MKSEDENGKVQINGRVIYDHERNLKLRDVGSVSGTTIPKGVLNALRVKMTGHRFLHFRVIMDDFGRKILLVETRASEEGEEK